MKQKFSDNTELFERMPVWKALLKLAIPTVISQLVVMIYNLADTYFIGQTDDPYKVAAVSMAYVLFFLLNAPANLFGIGGGSMVSRLFGEHKREEAKYVSSVSIWGSLIVTFIYCILCLILINPLLRLLGASENTFDFAHSYVFWVIVLGGIPSTLSITLSHLLRSEGYGTSAGLGLTIGGILNILLDPLFMFVLFPEGQEVTGAAIATFISNTISLIYYIIVILSKKESSVISLRLSNLKNGLVYSSKIFIVGIPSAVAIFFVSASMSVMNSLASNYGDIPVAAIGIVKKLEMLPHNTGAGICQGMIPLIAYNYASGNHVRMKKVIRLSRGIVIVFACFCIVLFTVLANEISSFFIKETVTLEMTIRFLKIMVLATPLTVCNFHMTYSLQAMGKGLSSLILSCSRQGIVLIPLLFIIDQIKGLNGLIWAQLIAEAITMIAAFILFSFTIKNLKSEKNRNL